MQIGGNFRLGPVTIGEELLLVVQQLLAGFYRELLVLGCVEGRRVRKSQVRDCNAQRERTLDNSVNWASFLAESTVNAFRHVDV